MKVANVHDVYVTDAKIVIGIKTGAPVDEKAIREILRKNRSASLFSVTVPEEPKA